MFVVNMFLMIKNDLSWVTSKWGYEKPGPWFFGLIGLVLFGWAFVELLIANKGDTSVSSVQDTLGDVQLIDKSREIHKGK